MICTWVKLSVNHAREICSSTLVFLFIFSELTIKTVCIRCILQSYFEGMVPDTHQVVTNLFPITSEKFVFPREHNLYSALIL